MFVSPKEQGRGIGGLLMDKAKSLRNRLRLSVYKENQKSVRFYEKRGFSAVQEQMDEHTGCPEIVMTFCEGGCGRRCGAEGQPAFDT
ncbi:MAG: GNAT family N-acetyltransferase [Desulfatibacillum sp.]|nr:GNAT family N-acetyltransferase [Desulfatibacillum sp.]